MDFDASALSCLLNLNRFPSIFSLTELINPQELCFSVLDLHNWGQSDNPFFNQLLSICYNPTPPPLIFESKGGSVGSASSS